MDQQQIDRQRIATDMVRREVYYCVSSLVATLVQSYNTDLHETRDMADLVERAFELASPVPDYEEAAIQAGWVRAADTGYWCRESESHDAPVDREEYATAEGLCREHEIEPYDREVYEHWLVSGWLGKKLAEKGEKVDTDFAGMVVWARTCTGQAIALDSVIEAIAVEAAAA